MSYSKLLEAKCSKYTLNQTACDDSLEVIDNSVLNFYTATADCYSHDYFSLQACWHQEPDKRPAFENVIASLRALLLKTFSKRQRSQGKIYL